MSLNITTSVNDIDKRSKTDVQAELPGSNPFLDASFLAAIIAANSGRQSEIYKQQQQIIKQMFPDTATGLFAERWGSYRDVTVNAATQSLGLFTATGGVLGSDIPAGQILTYSNGLQYQVTEQRTISLNQALIQSLTRVGTTATAITVSAHGFASGITVIISGAAQSEYNVSAKIIVTGINTFTYQIVSTAVTPATGAPIATVNSASVPIKSVDFGEDTNLPAGAQLSFQSQLDGVDNAGYVQFDGVTGGADIEDDADFKVRYLYSYRNPNTPFNVAEINILCKQVGGVTRVFVFEITPGLGQVTVYFVRDNDENIIPSGDDVDNVKNILLTIKPADMASDNVIVLAPDPKIVNFTFGSLTPDTTTMRSAIQSNLAEAFKADSVGVGVTVQEEVYHCTIFNTIDPQTGQKVSDFSLLEPIGDIPVSPGQIAVLGSIN